MHYLLILFLALALTVAWQTSVVADNPSLSEMRCAESPIGGDSRTADFGNQPECR